MPGKHSIKQKRAERTPRRRAAEVVDAHTLRAHLLTPDALAAGRHPRGRYIAENDLSQEDQLALSEWLADMAERIRERALRTHMVIEGEVVNSARQIGGAV